MPSHSVAPSNRPGGKAVSAPVATSGLDKRAAKRAEKLRRKNSTDPADMGRIKQIVRAYQVTHE